MKKAMIPILLVVVILLVIFTVQKKKGEETASGTPRLRIAMSGLYPPFNFRDAKNELSGFDVDIANEIAHRLGREPKLITSAWDGILAGLVANKYDLIVGSMAITSERQKAVNFTDPYYLSGAQLIVPEGSAIKGEKDLAGKVVGATLGETYGEYIKKNFPEVKRIATYKGGVPNLLLEIKNKRIDAFVSDRLVGLYAIKQSGNTKAVLAGGLLYKEEMGIAVQKKDTELLEEVNNALEAMKEDGKYAEISQKWFGKNILETD